MSLLDTASVCLMQARRSLSPGWMSAVYLCWAPRHATFEEGGTTMTVRSSATECLTILEGVAALETAVFWGVSGSAGGRCPWRGAWRQLMTIGGHKTDADMSDGIETLCVTCRGVLHSFLQDWYDSEDLDERRDGKVGEAGEPNVT